MKFGYNSISLIGTVANPSENGNIVRFHLAVNDRYVKNGEVQQVTDWFSCVIFNPSDAETEYLKKGVVVFVEGRVRIEKYTDKEGIVRTGFSVIVRTLVPVTPYKKGKIDEKEDAKDLPF